jgi:hypothetical protein
MNSSGLLEPSYLSMDLGLNLLGQTTCLSDGARAWKPPLLARVVALFRDHHGGVGERPRRRLLLSMMLWRSSQSRPYSHCRWFCVIRRRTSLSARRLLPLADAAVLLWALLARLFDRLPPKSSAHWFSAAATMLPATSTLCWAKATSGEFGRTIRWIDSMIV